MTPLKLNVTLLKSQTDFTSPFSAVQGKIKQKNFNGKYPHTIRVHEAEKSWVLPKPRVSISHPFFVSRNTKQSETNKLLRNRTTSEISFRFVLFRQK
jgi:hypothetical protein